MGTAQDKADSQAGKAGRREAGRIPFPPPRCNLDQHERESIPALMWDQPWQGLPAQG